MIRTDKYVVAVSGGVDSVVLLDKLAKENNTDLIVAHFHHGVRSGSELDATFVKQLALNYGFAFVLGKGQLPNSANEELMRRARYDFLFSVQSKNQADKIFTAHHQDDEIETAVINLLRGTAHRGIAPMRASEIISRPLLDTPKSDLIKYAKEHKLIWREDPSNEDTAYLRNYVRLKIMPELPAGSPKRAKFLKLINTIGRSSRQINEIFDSILETTDVNALERHMFIMLPHAVAAELMSHWLRANNIKQFDAKTIRRLSLAAKTAKAGTRHEIKKGVLMLVGKNTLQLEV